MQVFSKKKSQVGAELRQHVLVYQKRKKKKKIEVPLDDIDLQHLKVRYILVKG